MPGGSCSSDRPGDENQRTELGEDEEEQSRPSYVPLERPETDEHGCDHSPCHQVDRGQLRNDHPGEPEGREPPMRWNRSPQGVDGPDTSREEPDEEESRDQDDWSGSLFSSGGWNLGIRESIGFELSVR